MGDSNHSVLQPDTQGDTKEVATLTDAVAMTCASTSTNSDHYCSAKYSTIVTDTSVYQDAMLKYWKKKCLGVTSKKLELKSYELSAPWSEDALKSDECKVKFYMGLPSFSILIIVYI